MVPIFPPPPQLTAHEKAHDSETPSRSPQPPMHEEQRASATPSLSLQPPTHEELRASVKRRPVATRKAPVVCASRRSDEKRERAEQEKRKRRNEQRLEAQKLEVERIREAQRKAKEEAAAAARAQSERETNGGEHPSQRRSSGSEDEEEASRDQWHKPTVAIKVDDDQKVDDDDDGDTSAIYLAIPDEEHPESHLIMMAHPTSAVSFAPPSPPITPHYSSDSISPHSGLGYCYYGHDDVTCQCECCYQCGLVNEDIQTGMESNYLFDPPPLFRWPSPRPVDTQTRQDAADVLFPPSLERSGDSAGTTVITVVIPEAKAVDYAQDGGISTSNMTREFQRDRYVTGRGGYRDFHWRGRDGRGPRFQRF
jgi:hypothetical protein